MENVGLLTQRRQGESDLCQGAPCLRDGIDDKISLGRSTLFRSLHLGERQSHIKSSELGEVLGGFVPVPKRGEYAGKSRVFQAVYQCSVSMQSAKQSFMQCFIGNVEGV